jgi:hypothetical protein
VTGSFVLDYLLLTFLASCGVFQMAAAWNGLNCLLLLPWRGHSFAIGVAACAAAGCWFFLSESRNVPDTGLGLNGNQQFGYFFAGSGLGLAFTLIVSTMVSMLRIRRSFASRTPVPRGLDALRDSNYFQVLVGLRGEVIAYLEKSRAMGFRWGRIRRGKPAGRAGDGTTEG